MFNLIHNSYLRASYVALGLLAAPKAFATAGTLFGTVPDIGGASAGSESAVRSSVISILETVLRFMALVAVIIIVIAGIRLVISQGEEEAKDKAKKTIFYAIIGLIVILFAQAIVSIIADVVAS